jgi:primosomal protein N' (replication factor Y)
MTSPKYANIAFNLPIDSLFTYIIPKELLGDIQKGSRVLAPFGKRTITGIVLEFPGSTAIKSIKPLIKILDIEPVLSDEMIEFCRWISGYYLCPVGEVIFSAVPKGILVESKILYWVNENYNISLNKLTELQQNIIDKLGSKALTIKQLENKLKNKSVRSSVHSLLSNEILQQKHITTTEKTKTKEEQFVVFELLDDFKEFNSPMLNNFFRESKIKSTCQIKALKYLVNNNIRDIRLQDLLKSTGVTSYSLNSMAKKEIIAIEKRQVNRNIEHEFSADAKIVELNPDQKTVLNKIRHSVNKNEFKAFLLFGVTGSGKTQVYIEAISNVLEQGKTAIVLVPEIALTPQLIHRFKTYFGDIIGVIHSKLTDGQRFDVFNKIRSGEITIVIGARSALFAPLKNIGIIIVDEEHDHSYKQTEKNPKYNARDSAILRAKLNNAVVVLGSATPSLESYYNYRAAKYELLELPHRALKTKQPVIEIVDMLGELKSSSKFVKYETPEKRFLSSKLISYIDDALKRKQSIILLQNRRGYSAYSECQDCGNVKMCINCDITLIYHKVKNHLRCHYCGHVEQLPEKCEICGSQNLLLQGTGTEKVEEEIERLFPKARIKRMDADTVKGKDAHRKILKSFHDREFDILIGTQMISKGLDFPNVYLVGVISADIGLMNPDFRSLERTYQLLAQVSGRSGRASDFGKVLIQTMHADNYIFPYITEHNYKGFFEKEIASRKNFNYPPFSRMILIEVSGPEASKAGSLASKIYLTLKDTLKRFTNTKNAGAVEIMIPAPALIYKIKNNYRYHLIIKSIKSHPESNILTEHLLKGLNIYLESHKVKSSEAVNIDVDPLSFY